MDSLRLGNTGDLYRIGELARLGDVSVKAIRHYSELGLVPPAHIADSGYRYYTHTDLERLELINALRSAGVKLALVKEILENHAKVLDLLGLHLQHVETDIDSLVYQKVLIKQAIQRPGIDALAYLKELNAVYKLDACKLPQYLGNQLKLGLSDLPETMQWKPDAWFLYDEALRFPSGIQEGQRKAWINLVLLLQNDSFLERLRGAITLNWEQRLKRRGAGAWIVDRNAILDAALAAAQRGESAASHHGQLLVQSYLDLNAQLVDCVNDASFPYRFLYFIEAMNDPLFEKYWELLGHVQNQESFMMWSPYQARMWLLEGLIPN